MLNSKQGIYKYRLKILTRPENQLLLVLKYALTGNPLEHFNQSRALLLL